MAESYPCPHCGEYLEVPAAMRDKPVRCASCQKVFTPGASNDVYDDDARGQRRRGRLEDDQLPPPRRGRRRFWIIFLGLALVGGLVCCGGFGYLIYVVLNPDWQTYESREDGFTAKFPGPVNELKPITGRAGDEMAKAYSAEREWIQEEFRIQCAPLADKDRKRSADTLLKEFADGVASTRPGAREKRSRVRRTYNGSEAMEFSMKAEGGAHTQVRIVLTASKAYILTVDGPGEPDSSPWVREFFDSFTVQEAVKGKN